MRNKITVLDPVEAAKPNIFSLSEGEMFRYVDRQSADAVYMKTNAVTGNGAIHLPTGRVLEVASGAQIERVKQLQIG